MRARTIIFCLTAIPVVVILAVMFGHRTNDASSADAALEYTGFIYADLPYVAPVFPAHPPKPIYTRKIVDVTTLDRVEKRLDKCDGPIASPIYGGMTILVAEHDYCGGSAWIGKIRAGQAVALSGPGIPTGTYLAENLSFQIRGKAIVADAPQADVVLQTCVSKTELVLVGMRRVA